MDEAAAQAEGHGPEQDPAEVVRALKRRLADADQAQAQLRREHEQTVAGLQQQIERLTRELDALGRDLSGSNLRRAAKILFVDLGRQLAGKLRARPPAQAGPGPARGLAAPAPRSPGAGRAQNAPPAHPVEAPNVLAAALPLFVIGCPRSGTTVTAKILNAHPAVLMTNETAVFVQLAEMVRKSRIGHTAGVAYGKEHHQLWANHVMQSARQLIESYYAQIAAGAGKTGLRYWGEKHPHHATCLDFISQLYPAAQYLYVIRDPRDTALSIAAMRKVSFVEALEVWQGFYERLDRFVAALGPERLLPVRYEDLVHDYLGASRQMFAWLGLAAEPAEAFIAQHQNIDAHTLTLALPVKADFRAKSVKRWQRELTEAERRHALTVVGHVIEAYGYER